MITGNDRKSLIDYRLTQAVETLELAEFLINLEEIKRLINHDNFNNPEKQIPKP